MSRSSANTLGMLRAIENRKLSNTNWTETPPDPSGEVWPSVTPSFKIAPNDVIFTIGSCFARNIEHHLAKVGCKVPVLEYTRSERWKDRQIGELNKYTPPAFRQSMEWAATIYDRDGIVQRDDCMRFAFEMASGGFIDTDIASPKVVTFMELLERRQHVYNVFAQAFRSHCLIMTPGYIETWYDKKNDVYMTGVLANKGALRDHKRFQFELRGCEDSTADLVAAVDIVRARNPDVRVLITTSPVPLGWTFTGQDIRIANTYSKAVVRAACGALTRLRADIDYFPSYESVMLSRPDLVWAEDRIHVVQPFVKKIVTRLLSIYLNEGGEIVRRSA